MILPRRQFLRHAAAGLALASVPTLRGDILGAARRRNAAAPSAYLVDEDCEGSGTPAGWTDTGSPDWDYTASPIVGSHSLNCPAGTSNFSRFVFAAQGDVWLFCRWRKEATASTVNQFILGFEDASGNALARIAGRTDLTNRLYHGSAQVGGSPNIPNSTNLAVWIHYIKGTGSDGVADAWIQTDGTENRPASPWKSITTGTATADAAQIRLAAPDGAGMTFDKVRVSTSEIGSNPA